MEESVTVVVSHRPEALPAPLDRASISSHGPEGDALLAEVRAAIITLSALRAHGQELGAPVNDAIHAALSLVERRFARAELRVAVVGERKAGKSTFLNALLGARLLGTVEHESNTVIWLRRADAANYRATFEDGKREEFSSSTPDRSEEIREQIEAAERAFRAAEAAWDSASAVHDGARKAVAAEEQALREAFQGFDAARDEAARLGGEVAAAEAEVERLDAQVAESGRALPALVKTMPPRWALWLWVARAVLLLVAWRPFRSYAKLQRAREASVARRTSLRGDTSLAAEQCRVAEARMSKANDPVEEARANLATERAALDEAVATLAARRAEIAERRADLERHGAERAEAFVRSIRELSDRRDRGKGVVELEIEYPTPLLPPDVAVIDTPGFAAEGGLAQERAWRVVCEQADGCILISELSRAVSEPTKHLLRQLREVVHHVLLVFNKMDYTFLDAQRRGVADPWEHVERARRIGTRRFAKEVGREPDTVLSVTVAAQSALEGDGLFARRFESEAAKLFQLLRHERALIVGAGCANAVRRCIGEVASTEEAVERAYKDRIVALEANRRPEPDRFQAAQLEAATPAITRTADQMVDAALEGLRRELEVVRGECRERISASSAKGLRALLPELEQSVQSRLSRLQEELFAQIEAGADRAVRGIEADVFTALRQRYEIAHDVTRASASELRIDHGPAAAFAAGLGSVAERELRSLRNMRLGLGSGGAATGAALGTVVMPGLGTAAGALIGALLAFAKTPDAVRQSCLSAMDDALRSQEHVLTERLRALRAPIVGAMLRALTHSMSHAFVRFGRWIAEPLEAERAAIQRERDKLRDMQELRTRLHGHDGRLAQLMAAAIATSVGLCR
jgi:hypothetical protein